MVVALLGFLARDHQATACAGGPSPLNDTGCRPAWFHCPKCGTSFGTSLLRLVRSQSHGLFACDETRVTNPVSQCGGSILLFGPLCTSNLSKTTPMADMQGTCHGAPAGVWPEKRLFGNHMPVVDSTLVPRLYGMFREPKARALSSYFYFYPSRSMPFRNGSRVKKAAPTEMVENQPVEEDDAAEIPAAEHRLRQLTVPAAVPASRATAAPAAEVRSLSPRSARWYAERIRGVVSRQLSGEQRGIVCTAPHDGVVGTPPCTLAMTAFDRKRAAASVHRVRSMRFVGLQEHWTLSICLLHAMTRTPCPAAELSNARPTAYEAIGDKAHLSAGAYDAIRAVIHAVHDPEDEAVYEAAKVRFWSDVERFNLTSEECEQRCAATPKSGLVVRGWGHMGLDRQGYPSHYSHLLRNWLPRLWECQAELPEEAALYVPSSLHGLYSGIASRYGMVLSAVPGRECATQIPIRAPSFYFDLFTAASVKASLPCASADVVLVQREAAHRSRRAFSNPAVFVGTVRDFCEANGLSFEAVLFEKLPFAEQQRKVCSTKLLVAQHGAGIGNALFSHVRPMVVIELPPGLRQWWGGLLGVEYGFTFIQSYVGHSVKKKAVGASWNGITTVNPAVLNVSLEQGLTAMARNALTSHAYPKTRVRGGKSGSFEVVLYANVTRGNVPGGPAMQESLRRGTLGPLGNWRR